MKTIVKGLKQITRQVGALRRSAQFWFALGVVFTVLISSCSIGFQQSLSLRVGINSWPGYAIAYYAQAAHLFEQRGLYIELVPFNNQQDNIRATMRGALDASFVPLWEVMQVDGGKDRPAFIMVADISAGSDGIVARSNIDSVADLKGKKVGVKLATVPHLVLLEALQTQTVSPSDVVIVDISNEVSIQQLKAGDLDAAVIWEPELSKTANEIGGNIIFTTDEVDSLVIDGLATRSSFVKTHHKSLTQFMLAWLDAIYAVETKPDEVFEIIGQQIGQDKEVFESSYAGLEKGDRTMNKRMFYGGRLTDAIQEITELLEADPRHNRIIRRDIEINASLMKSAIKSWRV